LSVPAEHVIRLKGVATGSNGCVLLLEPVH
jgi:hypothetical protein